MSDTERRFTFKLDTVANTAGVAALTTAVKAQTASQAQMGGAVKATQQWVAGWNTTVSVAADGSRRWGDANRKTIAELQAVKVAAQQAAQAQAAANAPDLKAIGAKWAKNGAGAGAAGAGMSAAASVGSTRDMGRAALEVSRAVEDAQYGIAGVLNNLPGLVMMLGGGAGLAGALSLAVVGATQLVKHLGGINNAVDPEIMKAKLEAIKTLVDASNAHMSQVTQDRFEADLKAIQDKAEAALGAWKQTLENADKTKAATDAGNKMAGDSAAAALNAETAGLNDPGLAAVQAKRLKDKQEEQARAKLAAEALAAEQAAQAAQQGIEAARKMRDQAESARGPFGSKAAGGKAEIVNDLRRVGISSDQEHLVSQYDAVEMERSALAELARSKEEKRDALPLYDPRRWKLANEASHARKRVSDLELESANLAPGVEDARAAMASGDVSFKGVDPAKLTPGQRLAFTQGQDRMAQHAETQTAAQERIKAASQAEAEASKKLAEAQQRAEAAKQAQRNFEINRTSAQLNAGELPDVSPEVQGQRIADAQRNGGLANDVPLPPSLPAFQPPDLSGTEQAFSQAMEQTGTAIHSTMDRVVGSSENLARAMATMRSQYDAKISSLEQMIEGLKTQQ